MASVIVANAFLMKFFNVDVLPILGITGVDTNHDRVHSEHPMTGASPLDPSPVQRPATAADAATSSPAAPSTDTSSAADAFRAFTRNF